MRLVILLFVTLFLGLVLNACKKTQLNPAPDQANPKQYVVHKQPTAKITDFIDPWTDKPVSKTEFSAHHDKDSIYFNWKLVDNTPFLLDHINEQLAVLRSDRVEIFMAVDTSLTRYYSFEIDLSGRVFRSKGKYGKPSDPKWKCPFEYKIQTRNKYNKYEVNLHWAKSDLEQLGVLNNNEIIAGIFRADFNKENPDEKPSWISWIDPKTDRPNFHIPSAFGQLILSR